LSSIKFFFVTSPLVSRYWALQRFSREIDIVLILYWELFSYQEVINKRLPAGNMGWIVKILRMN